LGAILVKLLFPAGLIAFFEDFLESGDF